MRPEGADSRGSVLGVALVNMIRTLDLEAHGARKIERAPVEAINDALARLQTILD